jgi:hypothetical protein
VGRRRFEHLHVELSVAAGSLVPRWALWLRLEELGWAPDALDRDGVLAFQRWHARGFLAEHGLALTPREERRLARSLARFDPARPTPEEVLERFAGAFVRDAR